MRCCCCCRCCRSRCIFSASSSNYARPTEPSVLLYAVGLLACGSLSVIEKRATKKGTNQHGANGLFFPLLVTPRNRGLLEGDRQEEGTGWWAALPAGERTDVVRGREVV